jgi:hypothetical protein
VPLLVSAVSQQFYSLALSQFFLFRFLDQFSPRTGDFQSATVKNAMNIVATAQMVRSFMYEPLTRSPEALQLYLWA